MSNNKNAPPTAEQEKKLLEEAKDVVQTQSFQMKRALDNNKLMDALSHASNMIGELHTSLLSPKCYYALYIEAMDHLRYLEMYLGEEKHGKSISKLYELVQYSGSIIPRLYLLVTVGSVYIKSKKVPAKDVLHDLVEMCRGVQHPTRGLFLRNYLSEMTKDKMPDTGSEYEGAGGSTKDAINFIVVNFIEMNKLWVRMQHQGPARDQGRRERERQELKILIGKNLARLSQLEGVDARQYKREVLPKILNQIVQCKDVIAQEYLMEIIIQIFSDEFHLATLPLFLKTCGNVDSKVDIKKIIVSLIDRLAKFASRSPHAIPTSIKIFDIFYQQLEAIILERESMSDQDKLAMLVSLQNLSLHCYPTELGYVDTVLALATKVVTADKGAKGVITERAVSLEVQKLLKTPMNTYNNVLQLIKLEKYTALLQTLKYADRKRTAAEIGQNAIDNATKIPNADSAVKLLAILKPLVQDEDDQPDEEIDPEMFQDEQALIARLIHRFDSDTIESLFATYIEAKKIFDLGGNRKRYTFLPLAFGVLRLATKIQTNRESDENWERKAKKVCKFAMELVGSLREGDIPVITLRLYLQCALTASQCGFEDFAYNFVAQAFEIYEEEIADSKLKYECIGSIVSVLNHVTTFDDDNYDTLVTQATQHSSRLLKKVDQSRAVCRCTHLFWNKKIKVGGRVMKCLQRSLKIANQTKAVDTAHLSLYIEILNHCLYYFHDHGAGEEAIEPTFINNLINHIQQTFDDMGPELSKNSIAYTHYGSTLTFIKLKQVDVESWQAIKLPASS